MESSKLFFALTGILAVLVTYNYLTKKPEISIERYDSFVSVKMDLFYGLLRTRDGNKYDKISKIETLFKEQQVPLCDESQGPDGRYIIFPLETRENRNFIELWNKKGEKDRSNLKRLSDQQMQNNRHKALLQEAGYEERDYNTSIDSKFYLENIGNPRMFFEYLNIPVLEKYKNSKENYYDNVFLFSDNYVKDVFRTTLEQIIDINLQNDFLEAFNGSRQLWTPYVITNRGKAIAKDIEIIFQPGSVYGIYELIESNLDHQGIGYGESKTRRATSNWYISDAKSTLLQIPALKPGEVKVVVVKSSFILPGDEILRIKDYIGEEKNMNIIGYSLFAFLIISVAHFVILMLLRNKDQEY